VGSVTAKEKLLSSIASLEGLKAIDELIRSKFSTDAPLLCEISEYLLDLGGKRMRPVLCLLVARAFGLTPPSQPLIQVASGIELIHMATLLHDDIIDNSPLRRHRSSPYARYGANNTLLAGDFLLTRAFSLCARLDQYIIDETEEACIELVEGEILEIPVTEGSSSIEASLTIARKKTASLFRLAAASAAHVAGLPEGTVEKLREFGEQLGIAFQILDDILDVISSEDLLGKKAGSDIKERKPSIINVLWIATGSPLAQRLISPAEDNEDEFVVAALKELKGSSVVSEARAMARGYAERAQRLLDESVSEARAAGRTCDPASLDALVALINYTLERME